MNKEAKKEANSTPVSKQEEAPNGFFISEALTDFVPTGTFAPEFVSMPPMERHFNDSVCLADQFCISCDFRLVNINGSLIQGRATVC
jgi:hypothetical protein